MIKPLRNIVLVGSEHKASATAIQEILSPSPIYHVTSSATLWRALKKEASSVGLVIVEDGMWGKNFGAAISRVRKLYGLPVVAVLSDANSHNVGNAILAGASGIVRGPILDVHGIVDAVNDALLAY